MARIERIVKTETIKDTDGNVVEEKEYCRTKEITRLAEPDYIKLYTEAWGRALPGKGGNLLPDSYRFLFTVLAAKMSYCDAGDPAHSQLVQTGTPYAEEIMKAMGWEHRDSLQKGLKELCACNMIRRVGRGCYQINPEYAAKGKWKLDPRVSQSNLEKFRDFYREQAREKDAREREKEKEKKKEKASGRPGPAGASPAGNAGAVPPLPDAPGSDKYDDGPLPFGPLD